MNDSMHMRIHTCITTNTGISCCLSKRTHSFRTSPILDCLVKLDEQRSESMSSADVSYLYVNDYSTLSQSLIRSVETKSSSSTRSDAAGYVSRRLGTCRRMAPTLSVGHRSKHVTLWNEDALKRERRRARYCLAARQWREKRQCIEEELHQQLNGLGIKQKQLEDYRWDLQSRRHGFGRTIDQHSPTDFLSGIVLTDAVTLPSFSDQHADDMHPLSTAMSDPLDLDCPTEGDSTDTSII